MDRICVFVVPSLIFLLFPMASSEVTEVKQGLVQFMHKLSSGNAQRDQNWGWNMTSDPCSDKWVGVTCDSRLQSVRKIVLNKMNFTGILDAASVCISKSLFVLSLQDNNISGLIPKEIGNCRRLTHLYVTSNSFSGELPKSLSQLSNLKRLDISNNNFSGELPNVSRISGLLTFLAQNNKLSGGIPEFDYSNVEEFNVSNNNFSGPIPDVKGRFDVDSFSVNPYLCGKPLLNACPPSSAPPDEKSKGSSRNRVIMYSGYIILALVVALFFIFIFVTNRRKQKAQVVRKEPVPSNNPSSPSSETKSSENRSEYSITSAASVKASSSLIVLSSPVVNELRFEELLQAPAELLGRGKHGSLYKVMLNNGVFLAVKRIKDWNISKEEFKRRMQRIDQVKHPNVLPLVAFYCSKQEKLLVYEYQPNGSLFKLLHGSQNGITFDWGSRLNVAASTAEALTFTHEVLQEHGIAHGNLKSTKILFNRNMDPCISEYGLMPVEQSSLPLSNDFKSNDPSRSHENSDFKADIHALGLLLLELLTGKPAQNNGFDLATWVHSVVREEWTVEVFDKALISEGASEERMLNLLQVALKCINPSPNERPSINQVATMINVIKEEEQRSTSLAT